MKTSKRLLSIVLMLAMLVSMFTVMAFADDEKVSVTFDIGANGTVRIGNETIQSGAREFTYAELNTAYVAIRPNAGYAASASVGGEKLSADGFNLSADYAGQTIKITFTAKTPGEEPTPTPEPTPGEDEVSLRIGVQANGATNPKIYANGNELDLTKAVTFTKAELKKGGVKLTAEADGTAASVKWTLNEKNAKAGKSFTLPANLANDSKLFVEFPSTEPEARKYTLSVSANDSGMGSVQYGENKKGSLDFSLEKGETVTVKAVAKSGYEFVEWRSSSISISASAKKNATLDITMPNKTVSVTAVFQKIDSDEYTLKVRVSGSGDVTCGGKDVKTSYPMGDKDELTFKATATKSNYEVRWCIDDGKWHYTGKSKANITIDASDMGYDDATLYIEFVKDGSSTPSTKSYTLTVDISGSKYGKVTSKNSKVSDGATFSLEKNETRTFKAEPDTGYLAVWTFGTEVYVGSSYTVKMGSKNATLYVDFVDKDSYRWGDLPFHDVSNRNWYYDDVVYAYINGLMDGISMNEFGANQNTTRGQVVTILWRLTGEPRVTKSNSFTDVSSKSYYNTAISWAAENGIVKGYDAKTFRPDAYVTREQLAAILYRYADYMNLSLKGASNLMKFDDYYSIGAWARDSLAWANYHGLINGVDSYHIDPKGNTTRAQLAAILHRFAVEFG